MTSPAPLVVRAHAQVNLDLRIVARRPDGHHDLRTLFQSLALHDVLTFRLRRGPFVIESADADMPCDHTNLVWRAAQALWSATGRDGELRGIAVEVDKRIPSQAGLGGGSSDAAATLVALNRLWRAGVVPGDLMRLAAGLGADVPYFLVGGTALGLGRGETLYPLRDMPAMGVLLVKPSFGVATAEAYGWYAAEPRRPADEIQALEVPWYPGPLALANDLEAPVAARHPALPAIRRALRRRKAEIVLMSGRGSAVFGLFPGVPEAKRAADALRVEAARSGGSRDGRPWRAIVTRFVGRAAFLRGQRGQAELPLPRPIV